MKKLLLFVIVLIMTINTSFAKSKIVDYEEFQTKIEQLINNKNYKQAYKELKKCKFSEYNEEQTVKLTEQKEKCKLLSSFSITYDPYTKTKKYMVNTIMPGQLVLTILENESKELSLYALLKVIHTSNNWLFPKSITFLYDENTYSFNLPLDIKSDVSCSGGTCRYYEYRAGYISNNDLKYWEDIVNSNYVSMRIYGRQYHQDEKLLNFNKENISNTIKLYKYLLNGGTY